MINMGATATTVLVIIARTSHTRAWLETTAPPNMYEIAPDASVYLQQAVKEQNSIGWEHWLNYQWEILHLSWDLILHLFIVCFPKIRLVGKSWNKVLQL
jgi:hypothetical protein